MKYLNKLNLIIFFCFLYSTTIAQKGSDEIQWLEDGQSYLRYDENQIVKYNLSDNSRSTLVSRQQLTPEGLHKPIFVKSYSFSLNMDKVLLFTNSQKVWRLETRGDYWLLDLNTNALNQIGKDRPVSSLMFAKISPDGKKVAFVSEYNIYVEDVETGTKKQITFNGNPKLINGTFDWVYEEEFSCRDGFRWSQDSKQIAYWQIKAGKTEDYLMINNTDSIYPFVTSVEYPIAGEAPSPYKIGVADISTGHTKWMDIPTDSVLGSYVPRMEWAADDDTTLIIQHLNRKQNISQLMVCNTLTGATKTIYEERESAWIDILPSWDEDYIWGGWDWLNDGKAFVWASENDGWRHLYKIEMDTRKKTLITAGNYDVMEIATIDEKSGYVYFFASPDNATQKYLYRTKLNGTGKAERLTPSNQPGTHDYVVSPTGQFAFHVFSNYYTKPVSEWISLPDHKGLNNSNRVNLAIAQTKKTEQVEFFQVKTEDGVEMDAWMEKPVLFDPAKKYPVVFYVYTEPSGQNVKDSYGVTRNFLYNGDMVNDGYIYVSIDNRGTPVPKGRDWRKKIYRKIGIVNIRDQAMAAKEILKMPFIDKNRVAVWGWSGGGSATLNLMFQYPEIYKTGIAIAAVGNLLTYDNIYQERYMGLPQENREDYVAGSPITYAKNLKGNLLYIHGTKDDNVHYNNAEMLVNELVKYNKQFQFMSYPNRSHGLSEGEGTFRHLTTLYTNYLRQHCPPGGR